MPKQNLVYSLFAVALLLTGIFLISQNAGKKNQQVPAEAESAALGTQTKDSNCLASNSLPDSACTPGAVFATATKEQICTKGYSASVRNVPDTEKKQVYEEYGIASHEPGEFEVDHLISLELGGSNEIANLWPEAAEPKPGFHQKDEVENYLHALVCNGSLSLKAAQNDIAHNWLKYYPLPH